MHKKLSAGLLAVAALVCASNSSSAATLDDVMARLDSLQRDNQAMRKEIAALRQKEQRKAAAQAIDTRNAPNRQLSPAASSAMAAGYPVKARYAEPPRVFSWSGFYVGVQGGYGWNSSDWSTTSFVTPTPFTQSLRSSGAFGGIHGGANQQFGNWVLGLEADFSLINAEANSDGVPAGSSPGVFVTAHSEIEWLATFTGRYGYAFDRSLFYVKGGVAGAAFKENLRTHLGGALGDLDMGTVTNTRVGWTAGAGFEYAFSNNWTTSIEYDYLDFGTKDAQFLLTTGGASIAIDESIKNQLQLVKLGIHYKFGGDGR